MERKQIKAREKDGTDFGARVTLSGEKHDSRMGWRWKIDAIMIDRSSMERGTSHNFGKCGTRKRRVCVYVRIGLRHTEEEN